MIINLEDYDLIKGINRTEAKAVHKDLPSGGVWRTIKGHHIYIKDGKILAGSIPGVTKAKKMTKATMAEHQAAVDAEGKKTNAKSKSKASSKAPKQAGAKSGSDSGGAGGKTKTKAGGSGKKAGAVNEVPSKPKKTVSGKKSGSKSAKPESAKPAPAKSAAKTAKPGATKKPVEKVTKPKGKTDESTKQVGAKTDAKPKAKPSVKPTAKSSRTGKPVSTGGAKKGASEDSTQNSSAAAKDSGVIPHEDFIRKLASTSDDGMDMFANASEHPGDMAKLKEAIKAAPGEKTTEKLNYLHKNYGGGSAVPEYKPANPKGITDFELDKPKFEPKDVKLTVGDNHAEASAHDGGNVIFRKDMLKHPMDTQKHVMIHEIGHVISNAYPELEKHVFSNPQDALGRTNQKKGRFEGVSYTPEESWAESFARYHTEPEFFKQKYPKAYDFVDKVLPKIPNYKAYVDAGLKALDEANGISSSSEESSEDHYEVFHGTQLPNLERIKKSGFKLNGVGSDLGNAAYFKSPSFDKNDHKDFQDWLNNRREKGQKIPASYETRRGHDTEEIVSGFAGGKSPAVIKAFIPKHHLIDCTNGRPQELEDLITECYGHFDSGDTEKLMGTAMKHLLGLDTEGKSEEELYAMFEANKAALDKKWGKPLVPRKMSPYELYAKKTGAKAIVDKLRGWDEEGWQIGVYDPSIIQIVDHGKGIRYNADKKTAELIKALRKAMAKGNLPYCLLHHEIDDEGLHLHVGALGGAMEKSIYIDLEKAITRTQAKAVHGELPPGGEWRTMKGHHIYIKDGKILAGSVPGASKAKKATKAQLAEHQATVDAEKKPKAKKDIPAPKKKTKKDIPSPKKKAPAKKEPAKKAPTKVTATNAKKMMVGRVPAKDREKLLGTLDFETENYSFSPKNSDMYAVNGSRQVTGRLFATQDVEDAMKRYEKNPSSALKGGGKKKEKTEPSKKEALKVKTPSKKEPAQPKKEAPKETLADLAKRTDNSTDFGRAILTHKDSSLAEEMFNYAKTKDGGYDNQKLEELYNNLRNPGKKPPAKKVPTPKKKAAKDIRTDAQKNRELAYDVGDKVGGARKDEYEANFRANPTATSLADMENMSGAVAEKMVTKANLLPKYDFGKEHENGVDLPTAILKKLIYDRIAPKPEPSNPETRKAYMMTLKKVQRHFEGIKSFENMRDALREVSVMARQAKAGEEAESALARYAANPERWSYFNGDSYKERAKIGKEASKFMDFHALGDKFHSLLTNYESLNRSIDTVKKNTKEGWEKYLNPQAKAAPKKKGDANKKWEREAVAEHLRKGGKTTKVQKPEDLMKEFNLRGVEFGHWVNDSSGLFHLKRSAEAFDDLADTIGVDKKDISLNGRLAIAFGARGKGGALAHYEPDRKVINMTKHGGAGSLAHEWGHAMDNILHQYSHGGQESLGLASQGQMGDNDPKLKLLYNNVMEAITKTAPGEKGGSTQMILDSSVKNLSRYYPEMRRQINSDMKPIDVYNHWAKSINEKADRAIASIQANQRGFYKTPQEQAKAMKKYESQRKRDLTDIGHYIANELRLKQNGGKYGGDHYKGHIEISTGKSEYMTRMEETQQGKTQNGVHYWSAPEEMFARVFESYVQEKMKKANRENNYLVHGTSEGAVKAMDAPFPVGKERQHMFKAMENLLKYVGSKGTLKKAMMLEILANGSGDMTEELRKSLGYTKRSAYSVANPEEVIYIPINRLRTPYQTEKATNWDKVQSNYARMMAGENLEPVSIGLDYDVHDGHHRIEAAKKCGHEHIPCVVKGGNELERQNAVEAYREVWKSIEADPTEPYAKVPNVMFRGVGLREIRNINKTGVIQSKGKGNDEDKETHTCFSNLWSQAEGYARSNYDLYDEKYAFVLVVRKPEWIQEDEHGELVADRPIPSEDILESAYIRKPE